MNKKFVFFGTPEFATYTLNALQTQGIVPSIIVTAPDSLQGRGLVLTHSPVKKWALQRDIPVYTPEKIRNNVEIHNLCKEYEFAILAAYGKIIPQSLLDCFPKGILNVHPSLLPLYRGPSPLEYQILDHVTHFGVTIIKLDSGCDTGNIVAQREMEFISTPSKQILGQRTFSEGGNMLSSYLAPYLSGILPTLPQNNSYATQTKKIEKADGEIKLVDSDQKKFLKFLAYQPWPGTFFLFEHANTKIRLKITDASFEDGVFIIRKIIPEGKKEMLYVDFIRGLK